MSHVGVHMREGHYVNRIGWLRAAVLGANDGIISTSSLIAGLAASSASHEFVLLAGFAGLGAGAMAMAAGEFVSVSSQADAEAADLGREALELETFPEAELEELKDIYVARGLSEPLALEVAHALTTHNALEAHARDELGILDHTKARPVQAALASALTFAVGAALPLVVAFYAQRDMIIWMVPLASMFGLAGLGALGAASGGAKVVTPVLRVTFWGAMAMGLTIAIGKVGGAVVG